MERVRSQVLAWVDSGAIAPARLHDALRAAGALPDARDWRRFLERMFLGLGVAVLAASAVYFVAANWNALGRYAKFALAEGALAAAVAVALWRGLDTRIGQAGLCAAALLTGVLLALVGQVYQTGADTYELFAVWAVAIVAWVAVGRSPALWLIWIALLNMAVALYYVTFGWLGLLFAPGDWRALCVTLFLLDTAALAAWEFAASRGVAWLAPRWAPRILATAGGVAISILAVLSIVDRQGDILAYLALYALWLAGVYGYYRRRRLDLFVVAGAVLSVIVFGAAGLSRLLFRHGGAGGLFVIAAFVILAAGAGALWLRRLAHEEAQ
jgi:uncharacterized membrane protein